MFALIIAIIAIALTVYLAVSTLFYGGDALSNGSARAIASAFINQGQQINGAHTLYKNDNAGFSLSVAGDQAADEAQLNLLVSGKYLSSVPKAPKGTYFLDSLDAIESNTTAGVAKALVVNGVGVVPDEVCQIINAQAGGSAVGVTPTVQGNSETFGCFVDATGGNTVWYRM
jgi:hypothetical protein